MPPVCPYTAITRPMVLHILIVSRVRSRSDGIHPGRHVPPRPNSECFTTHYSNLSSTSFIASKSRLSLLYFSHSNYRLVINWYQRDISNQRSRLDQAFVYDLPADFSHKCRHWVTNSLQWSMSWQISLLCQLTDTMTSCQSALRTRFRRIQIHRQLHISS